MEVPATFAALREELIGEATGKDRHPRESPEGGGGDERQRPPYACGLVVAGTPAVTPRRAVTAPRPSMPRPSAKFSQSRAVLNGMKFAPLPLRVIRPYSQNTSDRTPEPIRKPRADVHERAAAMPARPIRVNSTPDPAATVCAGDRSIVPVPMSRTPLVASRPIRVTPAVASRPMPPTLSAASRPMPVTLSAASRPI